MVSDRMFILWVRTPPLETFDGIVIAVYHRTNDVEDKWIIATEGTVFSDEEILKSIFFVEQFLKDICADND